MPTASRPLWIGRTGDRAIGHIGDREIGRTGDSLVSRTGDSATPLIPISLHFRRDLLRLTRAQVTG